MEEIFKRILDKLKGADLWIALGFLAAGYICWRLIGPTKPLEQAVLLRQISAVLALALFAGGAIWANHFFFQRAPVFSKDLTGILIMRMEGDDAKASLQRILIANLNAKLQNEALGQKIEVHAGTVALDESKGIAAAHHSARAIGERLNARLVIWGQIGDKKFYPRITVVNAPKNWSAASERTRDVQDITELRLPEELVDEPFYLIHFAAGYSYYVQKKYKEALPHFRAALEREGSSARELADLQHSTAVCDYFLSLGQKDTRDSLTEAIELLQKAANVYGGPQGPHNKKWAMTQNNLGLVYHEFPTGDRAANLQEAIAAYESALRVCTENDFPTDWAMTQNNLGIAYVDLPTGDRAANLQNALRTFESTLRVYTEKDSPTEWAATQNNLGVAYLKLSKGDTAAANLQKAIAAYTAALRVYTEKDFPTDWATTQNNLGNAYNLCGSLPDADRKADLEKAIAAYEAALRVHTEKNFPTDWARAQKNLANAYGKLPNGDQAANLQKAITTYEATLRVYSEKDFPTEWAKTQNNLGLLYENVISGDNSVNWIKAKICFEAALSVYTESGFPEEHRDTSAALRRARMKFVLLEISQEIKDQ